MRLGPSIFFPAPAANQIAHNGAKVCTIRRLVKADDDHTVALRTLPPPTGPVRLTDCVLRDQAPVAFVANVIIAIVALVAVEPRASRRNRAMANITAGGEGQVDVRVLSQMRHADEGEARRIAVPALEGVDVRDGGERVRAVLASLDALVAEAPGAFEADVAIPVAVVCECVA